MWYVCSCLYRKNESSHTLSLGMLEVPATFAALGALGDPSIQVY